MQLPERAASSWHTSAPLVVCPTPLQRRRKGWMQGIIGRGRRQQACAHLSLHRESHTAHGALLQQEWDWPRAPKVCIMRRPRGWPWRRTGPQRRTRPPRLGVSGGAVSVVERSLERRALAPPLARPCVSRPAAVRHGPWEERQALEPRQRHRGARGGGRGRQHEHADLSSGGWGCSPLLSSLRLATPRVGGRLV